MTERTIDKWFRKMGRVRWTCFIRRLCGIEVWLDLIVARTGEERKHNFDIFFSHRRRCIDVLCRYGTIVADVRLGSSTVTIVTRLRPSHGRLWHDGWESAKVWINRVVKIVSILCSNMCTHHGEYCRPRQTMCDVVWYGGANEAMYDFSYDVLKSHSNSSMKFEQNRCRM